MPVDLCIDGPEAHHAVSVKRVRAGDAVRLFDGFGRETTAIVRAIEGTRRNPCLIVEAREPVRTTSEPTLTVASAIPKGDRIDAMIDQLAQLGARVWHPIVCARSEQREVRRADKLERRAIEAAKQCGSAWALTIAAPVPAESLMGPCVVLADASGERFEPASETPRALLIGPEGGWTDEELERARDAGTTVARFGRYTMRIETAAVAAAAIVLANDAE